ncbi:MAG: formylglycine-generating enzyme family protein [Candidatus Poribacteria bacterium]|nr:formylglycine-generating enzyme family protein [Candidatus Poribacteria bacterium]
MIQKRIVCLLILTMLLGCGTPRHIPSARDSLLPVNDTPDGMVLIPAGEFEMGRNQGAANERPAHTVYVDAFYMDIYEVTNAQYKVFIDANPQWQKDNIAAEYHDSYYLRLWDGNTYPEGKADHPVIYVSWYAAMAYAEWTGKRLPTEAEWEKAARGGLVGKAYPWGDTIDATRANYFRHINEPIAVGQYPPNEYGLYDMAGNVSEWCLDEYDPNFYAQSVRENPFSGGTREEVIKSFKVIRKKNRVLRGGCWSDNGVFLRVDYRDWGVQHYTSVFRGFRCVKDVPPK